MYYVKEMLTKSWMTLVFIPYSSNIMKVNNIILLIRGKGTGCVL